MDQEKSRVVSTDRGDHRSVSGVEGVGDNSMNVGQQAPPPADVASVTAPQSEALHTFKAKKRDFLRKVLLDELRRADFNVKSVADRSGIDFRRCFELLKRLGIDVRHERKQHRAAPTPPGKHVLGDGQTLKEVTVRFVAGLVWEALERSGFRVIDAAEDLGMPKRTLFQLISSRQLGIELPPRSQRVNREVAEYRPAAPRQVPSRSAAECDSPRRRRAIEP